MRGTFIILIGLLTVSELAMAQSSSGPYRSFIDLSSNTTFDQIFDRPLRRAGAGRVYLVVGDLRDSIEKPEYIADGIIIPTNVETDLSAPFPITQAVLTRHLYKYPSIFLEFRSAVENKRTARGLDLGLGSVAVKLHASPTTPLPKAVCLLATDNRSGGSIQQRNFFYQDRIADGVGGCLMKLNALGTTTVALPLVGSAMFATANGQLYPSERALVKCRLYNSISGIARAIGTLPNSSKIGDVAIILWKYDMDRLFGMTPDDVRRRDFGQFAKQARAALVRGLQGRATTSGQVAIPACHAIFGEGKK